MTSEGMKRLAVARALAAYYPIDSDNDLAVEGMAACRYTLVQSYRGERFWHYAGDDLKGLLAADTEGGWEPFLVVDMDTGKTASIATVHHANWDDAPHDFSEDEEAEPEDEREDYSWSGWHDGASECEPPEPGKEWLEIHGPGGNELAIVVLRTDASIFQHGDADSRAAKLAAYRKQKENDADAIVAALNAGSIEGWSE